MIINNDVLDLGFNAFNLTGINIIAEGAEIMALAVMTAQETAAKVAFDGTAATVADGTIDALAEEYVPSVINCGTAAEVVEYFDKMDEILTDENGCYHVKWLAAATDYACQALVSHLGDLDNLPANLVEAVRAYGKVRNSPV